jgi:hypothetical protein
MPENNKSHVSPYKSSKKSQNKSSYKNGKEKVYSEKYINNPVPSNGHKNFFSGF